MAANAIILAAGAGSRLASVAPLKPLAKVQGKPLIAWLIEVLGRAGIHDLTVVTGHRADMLEAWLAAERPGTTIARNADWEQAPNGVSLLAARSQVREGTLLAMADHLLSDALVGRLVGSAGPPAALALAVDRRLGNPDVDEADVTRVRTDGAAIRAIGKTLKIYDCYDTGLFRIGPALPAALATLSLPSLSAGVAVLARANAAFAIDAGDAPWLDVDDPRALARAEKGWRVA
jgi:1L-myo-inositol 1-phosphate cytidylyltransferase